jgi:Na+-transporting NADH:ubiquinone oxidoreductase subunit A
LVSGRTHEGEVRYISGNVLTGSSIGKSGYLGFYDHQLTLIPEGHYHEFFGWALPGFGKFSFSGTFPAKLFKGTKFKLDTNLHGGERAFVMTGQYDRVLPMDIYPVHLLKAILADDVELMEKLGIYEVDEEDFALCEVICTSKIEVQALIRRGLDLVRSEMS